MLGPAPSASTISHLQIGEHVAPGAPFALFALIAQLAHGCLVCDTPRQHRRRDAGVVVGILIGLGVSAGNIATCESLMTLRL